MPEISQEELDKLTASAKRVEEVEGKLSKVDETIKRLEKEGSTYKTRAKDAETKLSEAEKERLENNGDLQKRLDLEIEENTRLKADNLKKTESSIDAKLRTGISESIPNLQPGAIDLMLQIKEHKGLLKIDTDNESVDGIKEFGEACLKTHPWLQTKKKLKDTEHLPPGGDHEEDDDLSDSDKYDKELAACETQAQFDAVRKKWNRK
jgi:chromosome segregation ATPase